MLTKVETEFCDTQFGKLFFIAIDDQDTGACNVCGKGGAVLVIDTSDPEGDSAPCSICRACVEEAFTKHGVDHFMEQHKPAENHLLTPGTTYLFPVNKDDIKNGAHQDDRYVLMLVDQLGCHYEIRKPDGTKYRHTVSLRVWIEAHARARAVEKSPI